ncbi:MAG: sugar phosphate nucleotidyltransferase [Candidatus Hatepunaea meridiana]|nr:sugar phosphate nucleotidyltransferase [Candidatus Hatepunaea meridiana]
MKVIIPAAGFGSRLRPHTYTVPKALLPIAGKPIIGHILDQVVSWGGTEVTVIIGHFGDQLKAYLTKNYDLDFTFRIQEKILGLGHAVLTGLDPDDKELLIILGDTILTSDLIPVIKRGITSIGVKEIPDPRKKGVVVLENERVIKLIEKPPDPPSNLAIVGIYYIRDGALLSKAINEIIEKNITVKGEFQITDALQLLIDWGEPFRAFPVEGWYDCGSPETLLETNKFLFNNKDIQSGDYTAEESIIIPPVAIGNGTTIKRSIIGPYVSIGNDVVIQDTIIKNSIIAEEVNLERALLESAIIGKRADVLGRYQSLNLGASTQIKL